MNLKRLKELRRSRSEVFMLKTWAYAKQTKHSVEVASAFILFHTRMEIAKLEHRTLLLADSAP